MDLGLKNRVSLVAGASKGLGRAIAEQLSREGARLAICSRTRHRIDEAAAAISQTTGGEVHPIVCDLGVAGEPERAVAETVARYGQLDVLVTNTGGPPPGLFSELAEQRWYDAHEHLLLSAIRLIRAAVPQMTRVGAGRIVNITSISAKQPISSLILSNAYRAAIIGMGKTLAAELAPAGILVNNVCPGRIATDRLAELDSAAAERQGVDLDVVKERNIAAIPLARYGEPAELAALVAFLCSSRASYITGTTIACDGGASQSLL